MSNLRQRHGKAGAVPGVDDEPPSQTSMTTTTAPTTKITESATRTIPKFDDAVVIDETPTLNPLIRVNRYLTKPRGKRRHGLIFLLGGLFGIFVAGFFANQNELINLDALRDLNLDALIDVIPQGILRDAKEFTVRKHAAFSLFFSLFLLSCCTIIVIKELDH
jgi:hypothetical protein